MAVIYSRQIRSLGYVFCYISNLCIFYCYGLISTKLGYKIFGFVGPKLMLTVKRHIIKNIISKPVTIRVSNVESQGFNRLDMKRANHRTIIIVPMIAIIKADM